MKRSELFNLLMARFGKDSCCEEYRLPESLQVRHELPPLRILVAEDSLMGQKLIRGILERHGHLPVIVNTGREVVEHWETGQFDVVLMTCRCRNGRPGPRPRSEPRGRRKPRTPILPMTAHAMRGDEERCLAAGMDGYVSKLV